DDRTAMAAAAGGACRAGAAGIAEADVPREAIVRTDRGVLAMTEEASGLNAGLGHVDGRLTPNDAVGNADDAFGRPISDANDGRVAGGDGPHRPGRQQDRRQGCRRPLESMLPHSHFPGSVSGERSALFRNEWLRL